MAMHFSFSREGLRTAVMPRMPCEAVQGGDIHAVLSDLSPEG